ncbi:LCP family protein [Arthrobacter bambusae]|uniref:LCP family protein required for cell wall assembly n=1 Tax=Arthrobacter bambusae TaxID=1338426 RepID=A0AAW8DGX6_9MICC|nr:LCP family protein [Arthrobacter bambusae]MDP9904630.1 LCP family protein required for cell wall assembly [Arthrobacter bambusae]MDQ0129446.1 LCP family protein required for cell wall assembly [Arthrobacter bambusae]MDQ0180941.1 LCP family protein required for cell wall assembly [Arthrobacter bambusae]
MTDELGITKEVAPQSGPRRQKERKSHKPRNVLLAAAALLLVAATVAGGYVVNLVHTFNSGTKKIATAFPEESTRPQKAASIGGNAPLNILLLGSDSRGATETDAVNGSATDQRSDTLMLLHIPADRKNIYTISLMRDTWVPVPGHGEAKINAALAFGGVPLMVQTVEAFLKQRIDHVAMINFDGFEGLTNSLGGVNVNVTFPFTSSDDPNLHFNAGHNTLSGQQALSFVRERYAFPDGDYQRVRNQQAFIKGLVAKTINANTLSNPVTISNMVGAFSPYVAVDSGLDAATIAKLAFELKDIRQQDMVMFTLPTRGTGTSTDGQSIVLTDPAQIGKVTKALSEDKLGDYVAANNFEKGN